MKKNLLTSLKELLKAFGGGDSNKTNIIEVIDEITEQIESTPQSTPLPSVSSSDNGKILTVKNSQWTKDFIYTPIIINSDNTNLNKTYNEIKTYIQNGYLCIIKNPDYDDTRSVTYNMEFIIQIYDDDNHAGMVHMVQSISLDHQQGNIIVKKYSTQNGYQKPRLVTQ